MSRSIPPEIIDLIVDHLHDRPTALRVCCLVSKSWVPRSRAHLFVHIKLTDGSVQSWLKAFPDPLNSTAPYTRTLMIRGRWPFSDASSVVAGRIRAFPFHNLVQLSIHSESYGSGGDRVSLVPFHGLSPTIRSLRLALSPAQPSEVLGLICSFPILEDLELFVFGYWNGVDGWTPPSTSPRLTGSLQLHSMDGGVDPITRRLLDLPNGPNFTKIVLSCADDERDFKSTTDLVSGCSNTLESLDVSDYLRDSSAAGSFNLSTATKLKQLVFQCRQSNVQWIAEALQTVESKNLERITVRPDSYFFPYNITEPDRRQWHTLDRLLVQFWTSHSIRPKVTYEAGAVATRKDIRDHAPSLLPELSRRGLVDLVEYEC